MNAGSEIIVQDTYSQFIPQINRNMAVAKQESVADQRPQDHQIVDMLKTPKEVIVKADGDASEDSSQPSLDYAGSAEKTDPEEIKLVKKLDIWILVSLLYSAWNAPWRPSHPRVLLGLTCMIAYVVAAQFSQLYATTIDQRGSPGWAEQ